MQIQSWNEELPPDWDDWLATQSDEAGFCQTSVWAELNGVVNGAKSYLVTVDRNGERAAAALLSQRQLELGHAGFSTYVRTWLGGLWLECFEGPVLVRADRSELLHELLIHIDSLAAQLGVSGIRFNGPPVASTWAEDPSVKAAFKNGGYRETPWLTALVDLARDEEVLLKSVDRSVRKNIRRCREVGVSVHQCKDLDSYIHKFSMPYAAAVGDRSSAETIVARARKGWKVPGTDQAYRFFWAEAGDGTVLATLGTYAFNGVVTEIMSSRTPQNLANRLPAQDLLHWEIFRSHKAAGDRLFNLAGFSPAPTNAKEEGIRRFKEKWGGRVIQVSQFTKGKRRLVRRLARRAIVALKRGRS